MVLEETDLTRARASGYPGRRKHEPTHAPPTHAPPTHAPPTADLRRSPHTPARRSGPGAVRAPRSLHGPRRGPCAAAPAHGSGRGSAAGPQLLSISHGEPESVSESVTLGRF